MKKTQYITGIYPEIINVQSKRYTINMQKDGATV